MRSLSQSDRAAYLLKAGDAATASVGAYRLEEVGAALFNRIDGDYFTILGLPLLPLLDALRQHGIDPITSDPAHREITP
jgi:septum formation protein